jgi:hypothetical protein
MPHLTRLRFVNVGHVNARMDDVTLHCCDATGQAVDTTFWLRNGGGKSSILNLFYSLVNPNRRHFLGSKADQGERVLEDYILQGDCAVVIAEWQLDTNEGDEKKFYLTGGFYEWRQENLERLFFAAHVVEPLLSLDKIPLQDSQNKRFNLHGFKQAWQNLGKERSQLDAREFDNQHEWRLILEREAKLDPELFSYQLRMNAREGGADELFRFKDTDQFLDFFLELVLPTKRGEDIARNLSLHKTALLEREQILKPSQTLIHNLLKRVTPMVELASLRKQQQVHIGELRLRLERFTVHLKTRMDEVEVQLQNLSLAQQKLTEQLAELNKNLQHYTRRRLSLERHRLEKRLELELTQTLRQKS